MGLGLVIGIRDWDLALALRIRIGDWELGSGIGISD